MKRIRRNRTTQPAFRPAARLRRTSVLPQAKPRRRRNSLPPSMCSAEGWSRPLGGGTQKERHLLRRCLSFWWRRGELNPRSPSSPSFSPVPSGLAPQWIAVFRVFSSSCLVRPIPFSLVTFYLPEYLPTNRKAYVELPVTNFPYMFPVLFFECSNRHLENSVRLSIGRVGHTTQ